MMTQELIKSIFHYCPITGVFTWKERPESWFEYAKLGNQHKSWNTRFSGKPAGIIKNSKGKKYNILQFRPYSRSKILAHRAHRVAWFCVYGDWPKGEIDHIDGNGMNNAILNLRDVTRTENMRNTRKMITNTSGVTGIHEEKNTGKFEAHISNKNKKISLGRFAKLEDAIAARKLAEIRMGYHVNHGSDRPL